MAQSAASMPSSEVPDMRPTTRFSRRPRSVSSGCVEESRASAMAAASGPVMGADEIAELAHGAIAAGAAGHVVHGGAHLVDGVGDGGREADLDEQRHIDELVADEGSLVGAEAE